MLILFLMIATMSVVAINWLFLKDHPYAAHCGKILQATTYIVVNMTMVMNHPEQVGLLFLIFPSVNAIANSLIAIWKITHDEPQ